MRSHKHSLIPCSVLEKSMKYYIFFLLQSTRTKRVVCSLKSIKIHDNPLHWTIRFLDDIRIYQVTFFSMSKMIDIDSNKMPFKFSISFLYTIPVYIYIFTFVFSTIIIFYLFRSNLIKAISTNGHFIMHNGKH